MSFLHKHKSDPDKKESNKNWLSFRGFFRFIRWRHLAGFVLANTMGFIIGRYPMPDWEHWVLIIISVILFDRIMNPNKLLIEQINSYSLSKSDEQDNEEK